MARRLIVFARMERIKLRGELENRFGFVVEHGEEGYRCRFEQPARRPRTPEQAARWADLFVHALAFEEALLTMHRAATDFAGHDQARMVCNTFLDTMRESPAVYGALAEAPFEPRIREYASSMRAAWARSYLKAFPGSKVEKVLKGEDPAAEPVNAAALAWAERDPHGPLKRSTRFRDTLRGRRTGAGRRPPGRRTS